MAAKQIFSNNAILAFLNREIISRNPEFTKRLYYMENEDVNTLIKRYRGSTEINPGTKFQHKLPILGYKRSAFKRDENLFQRNTVKVNTSTLDFTDMDPEFVNYFKPNESSFVDLTAAITQLDYTFYLVGSDLDAIQQYEQAYLSRMFLSDITTFELNGALIKLGSTMNMMFTVDWDDLDEFNINTDGMIYSMISGKAKIRGQLLYSSGVSSYLIDQINLSVSDLENDYLFETINIKD